MSAIVSRLQCVNALRPEQNGCYLGDDIPESIFMKQMYHISIEIYS